MTWQFHMQYYCARPVVPPICLWGALKRRVYKNSPHILYIFQPVVDNLSTSCSDQCTAINTTSYLRTTILTMHNHFLDTQYYIDYSNQDARECTYKGKHFNKTMSVLVVN